MTQLAAKEKSRQTMALTAKWHTEELKNLHKKSSPTLTPSTSLPKKDGAEFLGSQTA